MAEFKLGRFRYTWKGQWGQGTSYIKDDVIQYGGSSWICVRQHTASIFNDDLTFVPPGNTEASPAWIKMTDGYAWRSLWQDSTRYDSGDIVLYGGNLYICIDSHASTEIFDDNILDWAVYSTSLNFVGDWAEETRYGIGDVVVYGGNIYKCVEGHESALTLIGLEEDLSKWELLFNGVEYKGNWSAGFRYKINDLVKFGGSIFKCKIPHVSQTGAGLTFDDTLWDTLIPGAQYTGQWNNTTVYPVGALVNHGGYVFYSVKNNYDKNPTDSIYQTQGDPNWIILAKGINFRGSWSSTAEYKTGDIVQRGGNLYVAKLDTVVTDDGSTFDYLDESNWEIVTEAIQWRASWQENISYSVNDVVAFLGTTYKCNFPHIASVENSPGDNGNGFFYWDVLIEAGSTVGLSVPGDLLTYNLSRTFAGDTSTFNPTRVPIGTLNQVLSVDDDNNVIYRNIRAADRVFYVGLNGVDSLADADQGKLESKPWRTVRFACEQADDNYQGTTTIEIAAGLYSEVLPIIVPARTAVVGAELRTTTIEAKPANAALALDSTYTIAVLGRISQLIESIIFQTTLTPAKTPGNTLNPVILGLSAGIQSVVEIRALIDDIIDYINFYINSSGLLPTLTGTNTENTNEIFENAVVVLEANKEFLASEAVAFMQATFPSYNFDPDSCKRDVRAYIDAWKYDLIYTGNYKSLLAARYYRNAVLGSETEDMFYMRDATGLRNCTVQGLSGVLNPPIAFDLYRLPTGGAFVSLDPGWGPDDDRTWILTRSPYIQGVTTIGTGCVGQKIDGSLHNGGNKSMVSNDFTQVLSDGIGAWVTNQGRAELVSVFTYYCHIGYFADLGGIIRATNGNCSYGRFGALADEVDPNEVQETATINNRTREAVVAAAFAGEFTDEIQLLEWTNAGTNYTQASASFVGSGVNASVLFEDFRDDAVFNIVRLDTSTNPLIQAIGGGGFFVIQGNAQPNPTPGGDATTITLQSNDPNEEANYLGMRIVIVGGTGTGQYGYVAAYNSSTKVLTVRRESDDQLGWDNVIPGRPVVVPLDTTTAYRIEPRVIVQNPGFAATEINTGINDSWAAITYGEITKTTNNVSGSLNQESQSVVTSPAQFNVTQNGRNYSVTVSAAGVGYTVGDIITIDGSDVGGLDLIHDVIITVTSTTGIGGIAAFTTEGIARSGNFVALSQGSNVGAYSPDGENWTSFTMPSSGDWTCLAAGNNRFVAIRNGSSAAASSLDGTTWTARTIANRNWNSVVYGNGRFVAVSGNQNSAAYSTNGTTWTLSSMPTYGDSSFNEWVDVTYGQNKFVAVANSGNIVAESPDGITWEGHIMDVIDDSSQKDWVSIAYGNNRFVAISSQGDVSYSFDAESWLPGTMPTQDGSTVHNWKKIRYAQGVFFAVGDTGNKVVGADPTTGPTTFAATSPDGINWIGRELASEESWSAVAFGNPYIDSLDSTIGKNSPVWITVSNGSEYFNKIRTGATALARVTVSAGVIGSVKIWNPGSGYSMPPTITLVDPNKTEDAEFLCRLGDGVLAEPTWLNRGLGYRTASTQVTIFGDGHSDIIPLGKFIRISNLERYPGPGTQLLIAGNSNRYTVSSVTPLGGISGKLSAELRISPDLKIKDYVEHDSVVTLIQRYSQIRITGHDFLDIGSGNFEETNYPELYSGLYFSAPENEVVEQAGGRVFYTSTDQSGNFRTGELFAVEQATGIVTISADFFDFSGLTELRLGGIRLGGSATVIREFSTDPLLTEDSNNVVPTQRAISAFLENRLTVGGSEIATASFIAGVIRVGPDFIGNTIGTKIVIPVLTRFEGSAIGISGSMLAQTMFYRSFN